MLNEISIKPIPDTDIYNLYELHYKLQQVLPIKLNRLLSSFTFTLELQKTNILVVGLYKFDKLVGFINGWEESEEVFYMANIYVNPDSRIGVKKLMEYAEKDIKQRGYKYWKATSFVKDGMNILEKFGGIKI